LQQQHQQQEGEESMIGAISCDNQVKDMTDWDFSTSETIQEAINVVENRQGRAIILSTATGVTKFNRSQCNSVDPHRSMRAPLGHVNRVRRQRYGINEWVISIDWLFYPERW
jgi:hypothetical protein